MKKGIEHAIGEVEFVVTEEMTACLEDMVKHPVYSTFWLAYHAEVAARKAIELFFEESEDAVGASLSLTHLGMAAIGAHVLVRAKVSDIDGRTIRCTIQAVTVKEHALLAEGTQDQVVLSKDSLMKRIEHAAL